MKGWINAFVALGYLFFGSMTVSAQTTPTVPTGVFDFQSPINCHIETYVPLFGQKDKDVKIQVSVEPLDESLPCNVNGLHASILTGDTFRPASFYMLEYEVTKPQTLWEISDMGDSFKAYGQAVYEEIVVFTLAIHPKTTAENVQLLFGFDSNYFYLASIEIKEFPYRAFLPISLD